MNQSDKPQVIVHSLTADGAMPNNELCAVLVYPGAVALRDPDPAAAFEALFAANGWTGSWRNGIHPFHHFHSTAHEVLGIFSGEATVQFGGDNGITVSARAGDVVVVPAGVGHKKLKSRDLGVVGAYPRGQYPDMCVPKLTGAGRRASAVTVSLPECDPVFGADGPLFEYWRARS